jgi:RNase adaptor protein for sRNA GlmZ degradation
VAVTTVVKIWQGPDLRVISFGYGHAEPPAPADLTVDLRDWFRDPHPELQQLTGLDQPVVNAVMATAGVPEFIDDALQLVGQFVERRARTVVLAVGCVGGRHRSVVIADRIAHLAAYRLDDWRVEVQHRDVHRPVIQRGG